MAESGQDIGNVTRHPSGSSGAARVAAGPADACSRVAAGITALHTEIACWGRTGVPVFRGLIWPPVPALAGVGGIRVRRALRGRVQSGPSTHLAVADRSAGPRAGRGTLPAAFPAPLPTALPGALPGGPAQPGTGPAQPGTGPAQPGTGPAQPGVAPGARRGDPPSEVTTLELQRSPRRGMPVIDVTDLVNRVKNGEREAFGTLYDRYSDLVFRYVFYRVGSTQLTEDIVSETFLRALRRIGSFTWQGTDIGAWFITIARNLVIDHVRSSHTRLEFPTEDILSTAETHASGTANEPEDAVLTVLRNRTLLDAVRALSPDQQECVVLRFLEGLSLRETALAMDRKENAVKALQLRAVRALARRLPPRSELA